MKQKAMGKNILRTVRTSLGRYLAIVSIIALGAAMFVGLVTTKSDMVATGQDYLNRQNMYHLRLLSTYGWSAEQVRDAAGLPGIADAEGCIGFDAISRFGESETDSVYKIHSIPQRITRPYLLGGRMPQSPDECLIDGQGRDDSVLGTMFTITTENDNATLDMLTTTTFRVVGYVSTPLYMDISRGGTSIGNGSVAGYVYLPGSAFTVDYYTEIAVTMEGSYTIYTEEFDQAMANLADALEPEVTLLAGNRFAEVKAEAEREYADGLQSYQLGLSEYIAGRSEAMQKLAEAKKELDEGQSQLTANREQLLQALEQLQQGQQELDAQSAQLSAARQELLDGKAEAYAQLAEAYAQLMENYKSVNDGLKQISDNLPALEDGIAQIEDGLSQIEDGLSKLELAMTLKQVQITTLEQSLQVANAAPVVDQALLVQLQGQLELAQQEQQEYEAQKQQALDAQQQLTQQLQQLTQQRSELYQTRDTLTDAKQSIELGFLEVQNNQTQLDNRFAAAQAQIESGLLQLEQAQKQLDAGRAEAEDGMAQLEQAQQELDEGYASYEQGRAETLSQLEQVSRELDDAAAALNDARSQIDTMEEPAVYILDRNTNAGYLALDSNSDIVAGVARVFPAFFLLVAALVCITTMTRMVEEERTQIGTLKALGYSNAAIIRKYTLYAGSAAVLGCGLGVLVGSVVFPMILWQAYGIIFNIQPHILLHINWPLCLAVVGIYTAVTLIVTWYCCRRSLREVAAELIRPKAPASGRKILLEYLPFWNKISFLNKVMLRNVFRYHQRMLMMLIGIGGCTALLLTGFGLRDSISNLVTDQFENVTTNDLTVYFSDGLSPSQQQTFRQQVQGEAADVLFFYQTSADVSFDGTSKEIYLVSGDETIKNFMHFTQDGQALGMPGVGEAFLSIGVAENLGVSTGDTVTLTDSDMRELTVQIAGIYHNSVYNYAIVTPETLRLQWGSVPENQMAFLAVRDYCDAHQLGAKIMTMESVMNVVVTADIAEQVDSMLGALDMIVVTVVICAGALAMIVLYNLTNINITERIREIATIKVLGFHGWETAAYVFKENLLLSGVGVLVGLAGGWGLLSFVMHEIRVDMVWFVPTLKLPSIVLGAVLTMLAACLVDFLLYFKLERINMAEALKSVE